MSLNELKKLYDVSFAAAKEMDSLMSRADLEVSIAAEFAETELTRESARLLKKVREIRKQLYGGTMALFLVEV